VILKGCHIMSRKVILVTGTPCVGKTSVSHLLATRLGALYVNLTNLATGENLVLGRDEQRDTVIVDEARMTRKMREIIQSSEKDVFVDGHYAASVVPEKLVTFVFVLRRDPVELKSFMERCGFSSRKLTENLASEILDVCLVDALKAVGSGKVCEVNVTGKSVEAAVREILSIMSDKSKCCVGVVDWLGKLENEGLLDEFLKI
jgi:adenylate kinase